MSKLFACADIHGAFGKFLKALIKAGLVNKYENWCGGDSRLVLTGDNIDRGEASCEVIELIIKIKNQAKVDGGEVITLMGNHCQMLLDGRTHAGWRNCWLENGGLQMVESYRHILADKYGQVDYFAKENPQKIYEYHREYFDNLKSYVIINDILFVHAGVNPQGSIEDLETSVDRSTGSKHHLWIRDQFYNHKDDNFVKERYKVKKIVFGHSPSKYLLGRDPVFMAPVEKFGGKILGIDTGSYYQNGAVTIVEFDENRNWKIAAAF